MSVVQRRRFCLPTVVFCLIGSAMTFADDRPAKMGVEFDLQQLSAPPAFRPTADHAADGVQAIYFRNEDYRGQPTEVFAYMGVPESATPERPVPAMVLIHGGGGTAFDRWVRLWNSRGYAAIAMDLCGCVPEREQNQWKRHATGGPPGWGASFTQLSDPITDQWGWHAVTAVARAHSLLRADPRVDAERTGVTGISWGGYMTSIVAGVDNRFRCAIPVYGCGHLAENSTWLPQFKQLGPEQAQVWVQQWDPSMYLPKAAMPMLWVNGTNDFAYPMDSWQKSYRLPTGPRTLCLKIRMPHSHPAGETPAEILAFADQHLRDGVPLATVSDQTFAADRLSTTYSSRIPIVKAELCFTRDEGAWQQRDWQTQPAELDTTTSRATASVPPDARVFYLNLQDEQGHIISTEHITR